MDTAQSERENGKVSITSGQEDADDERARDVIHVEERERCFARVRCDLGMRSEEMR